MFDKIGGKSVPHSNIVSDISKALDRYTKRLDNAGKHINSKISFSLVPVLEKRILNIKWLMFATYIRIQNFLEYYNVEFLENGLDRMKLYVRFYAVLH